MNETNAYCEALGIAVPRLEVAKESSDCNYYSLFIVVLLERGEPTTLETAALRFEDAGVAPREQALASLKRCRPGRPPLYRDGDLYALDPHDAEAGFWVFRLGLRPPKATPLRLVPPEPTPLPSLDTPLTLEHVKEAWEAGIPSVWSAQRIAACVLDAHSGSMQSSAVIAFLQAFDRAFSEDAAQYWRRGAAIRVRADGRWELDREHRAVHSAREAVRQRIEVGRRSAHPRVDPAVLEAHRERRKLERDAHADELAAMRRVLIHAFPAKSPEAVVLLDVNQRKITVFLKDEIDQAVNDLTNFEMIAGVDVRGLTRRLGFDPGKRRLGELGPSKKTRQLNRRGRKLKITMDLLVRGSCGISRPFGSPKVLQRYLKEGRLSKLRRRLEADAKSLFALYEYGRLHGVVRLQWGFLDEMIPAPWVHHDERRLHDLKQQALEQHLPLEVVTGSAPGWAEPWSRGQFVMVKKEADRYRTWLVDEIGQLVYDEDVQLARLATVGEP